MTRGKHEHTRQTGRLPDVAVQKTRRWWNAATKAVITAGAIAGALASVIALWPSSTPDQQDAATFSSVRVVSHIPLSEFDQRQQPSTGSHSAAGQVHRPLVARIAADSTQPNGSAPVTDGDTGPQTPTAADSAVTRSTGTGEATSTSGEVTSTSGEVTSTANGSATGSATGTVTSGNTISSSASSSACLQPTSCPPATAASIAPNAGKLKPGGALIDPTPQVIKVIAAQTTEEVTKKIHKDIDFGCVASSCNLQSVRIISAAAHDSGGHAVSPAKAADNLANVLVNTRTVPEGGTTKAGSPKIEPLGVDVTADMELDGLRGKHVMLYWSIWQQGGNTRLFGEWLSSHAGYELTATTEKDTGSVNFWIPLPKADGQYFVRLELQLADGTGLASTDSNIFD